jgi:hypothetical protein
MSIKDRFTKIDNIKKNGTIISVWGREKCGKTHLALTASEVAPVYVFDFDLGVSEIASKFKGEIYIKSYGTKPTEQNVTDYEKTLNEFVDDYTGLLNEITEGVIVIDTGTHLWQLVQKVKMDKIKKKREANGQPVYPFDYADAEHFFASIINFKRLQQIGVNMILTHKAKEQYDKAGHPTGVFVQNCQSQIPYMVSAVVQVTKEKGVFYATIESCRTNPLSEGQKIQKPSYKLIMEKVLV